MVEGPPLHYYWTNPYVHEDEFPYFQQFHRYLQPSMEYQEDMIMPSSPNSTQSDSDASISSIGDLSPRQISPPIRQTEGATSSPVGGANAEAVCGWRDCGVRFSSLDQLANHVAKIHAASGRDGLFYCGWEGCNRNERGFNARYKMLVHVRTHTNEKPHQCTQCEKSFSRAENLKIHSRSHSGEKPYVCPIPGCNKAYSNSSDRFKHTRTHSVEKPYQCKVPGCNKRYTDPSSLRKHVKTYKHFINENIQNESKRKPTDKKNIYNEESPLNTPEQDRTNVPPPKEPINEERHVIKHPSNCDYICCAQKCAQTEGFYRLGAFINFENEENKGWNRFEPLIAKPKLYRPYELTEKPMEIEMDVPLDLSIRRNI